MPTAYTIAALWSHAAGASLLLAVPLAGAGALAVAGPLSRTTPWRVALLCIALLVCVAPLCFSNTLYARLPWVAPDGAGLDPRLQSPFALVHSPLLALGYALVIPYLLARLATLVVHAQPEAELLLTRRIALLGWLILGSAMLVALAWAYRDALWWDRWPMRVVHDGSLIAWVGTGASLLARGRRAAAVSAAA